jgi:hypothetical protein
VLVIIAFYVAEIIFKDSSNIFALSIPWFKWRALEAFAGPLIILTCIMIEKIINISKRVTNYLLINYEIYRKLSRKKFISDFIRLENVVIALLLISMINMLFIPHRIYTSYYFEEDHVDAVFYVKKNIPNDSKLLVSDFDHTTNSFYDLFSNYKVYIWDFEFSKNSFNETIDYIKEKNIDYIMLEESTVNSTERNYFKNYFGFEKLYENDLYIILEIEFET